MKPLQKIKVTVKDGKKDSQESVGKVKHIADSVADELLQQAKEVYYKSMKGVKTIHIWEEVEVKKAAAKDKK